MTDLDDFLYLITPHAPGCPVPTAFEYLIQAAQQFCERTRLWRSDDSYPLTGEHCEFVCTPAGADLFEVRSASVDGQPLEPISYDELNRRYPDWRNPDNESTPSFISQVDDNSLLIYPFGNEGTLQVGTVLRPANDADALPDFLFRKYKQELANGALGMILMLPGQSFTDPNRGQLFTLAFQSRLDQLFAQATKGQQRARARSKASYF